MYLNEVNQRTSLCCLCIRWKYVVYLMVQLVYLFTCVYNQYCRGIVYKYNNCIVTIRKEQCAKYTVSDTEGTGVTTRQ